MANIDNDVISISELTSLLTEMIVEIRANNAYGKNLKKELKKLKSFKDIMPQIGDKSQTSLTTLFQLYVQLQKVSMELRQLLNIADMEKYDSINYAIYYKNQRYAAEHLKAEWLTVSSSGELKLRLNYAVKDLEEDLNEEYQKEAQQLFNEHYAIFLNAITGTYRGKIGRGGALNKGHIAEAFESHISEHHKNLYHILNNLANSTLRLTSADKSMLAFESETNAVSYWANHEGISAAWQHIRDALGVQRGTVAGDVGKWQVKSGQSSAPRIRLARYNTLLDGLENYNLILANESVAPAHEVAMKLARYLSESVRKMSDKIVDNIIDKETQDMMKEQNLLQEQNIEAMVHV